MYYADDDGEGDRRDEGGEGGDRRDEDGEGGDASATPRVLEEWDTEQEALQGCDALSY